MTRRDPRPVLSFSQPWRICRLRTAGASPTARRKLLRLYTSGERIHAVARIYVSDTSNELAEAIRI